MALARRTLRLLPLFRRLSCSSLAPLEDVSNRSNNVILQEVPRNEIAARREGPITDIVIRTWVEHRRQLPKLIVEDVLAEDSDVVLDTMIGNVFFRMALEKTSPDRETFLGLLTKLLEQGRLKAPPKLKHKYSVPSRAFGLLGVPLSVTEMSSEEKNDIGKTAEELMDWIVASKFSLPKKEHHKILDNLVAVLQCAFNYKSTIILTNNKDFYFLTRISQQIQDWLNTSYPDYGNRIELQSVRIIYVLEQLGLDVHTVDKELADDSKELSTKFIFR